MSNRRCYRGCHEEGYKPPNWGAGEVAEAIDFPGPGHEGLGYVHAEAGRRLRDFGKRLWGTGCCVRPPYGGKRKGRQISLSDSEWGLLQERARHVGLSTAEFVRVLCGLR